MSGKYEQPSRRPAVVTGASSGIGAATAIALAAAGFPVALGARRVERCEQVVETLRSEGLEAVAHPLDLHDAGSVAAFADAVAADLGDVEVRGVVRRRRRAGRGPRDRQRALRP